MDDKVGIIGAGIAGMTCAYELSKNGVDVVVLEKEAYVGGRTHGEIFEGIKLNMGALTCQKHYKNMMRYISELNLEDDLYELPLKRCGIVHGNDLTRLNKLSVLRSGMFSPGEMLKIAKAQAYAGKLNFDSYETDDTIAELHRVSAAEWAQQQSFSENLMKNYLQPLISGSFQTPENVAADQALWFLSLSNEVRSTLKNGMDSIPLEMHKLLGEKVILGTEILEVTQVARNEFTLVYNHNNTIKSVKVNAVVFAVPPKVTNTLMPQLSLPKYNYADAYGFIIKGDFIYKDLMLIFFPQEDNPVKIRYGEIKGPVQCFHVYSDEYDFTPLYKGGKFTILKEFRIEPATVVPMPGSKSPGLKTMIDNIYICGDFYPYSGMEGAYHSAVNVSEMIINS